MTGPGAIGSLELGMTVHLFGGPCADRDVTIARPQIGRVLEVDGAGYIPVTLHPMLPAWIRARWLAYAYDAEATRLIKDGSLLVWLLARYCAGDFRVGP